MRLIDLSLPIDGLGAADAPVRLEERSIGSEEKKYTGMVYHFAHDGMTGTYIDFPGHIKETDDGLDAATYPLEKLYRVDASVIHLDRPDRSGGVGADDLAEAHKFPIEGGALVINALGERRFDEIEERSVWLTTDAVQWIVDTGVHLLVSDIYESQALHGVFYDLFEGGVSTVCLPVNLHQLTVPRVKLTVLSAPFRGVTQLPCRLLAELPD